MDFGYTLALAQSHYFIYHFSFAATVQPRQGG